VGLLTILLLFKALASTEKAEIIPKKRKKVIKLESHILPN